MIFILKFTMEGNSMNNVGRVKVLDLCSSIFVPSLRVIEQT